MTSPLFFEKEKDMKQSNGVIKVVKLDGTSKLVLVDDHILLSQVGTITEAAIMWKKNRETIKKLVESGQLNSVKSAGTWLVSFPSCVARWGEPKVRLEEVRK